MTWYAWVLIGYIIMDRLFTIGWIGRTIDITRSFAVTATITGALLVWAILGLAGQC